LRDEVGLEPSKKVVIQFIESEIGEMMARGCWLKLLSWYSWYSSLFFPSRFLLGYCVNYFRLVQFQKAFQ